MPGLNTLGFNYTHLSGAGTTTIFSGIGATQGSSTSPGNVGIMGAIFVNTAGTSVTVYDSAAGSGQVVAAFGATTGFIDIPVQLKIGLTIVIVGTADVTVLWQ